MYNGLQRELAYWPHLCVHMPSGENAPWNNSQIAKVYIMFYGGLWIRSNVRKPIVTINFDLRTYNAPEISCPRRITNLTSLDHRCRNTSNKNWFSAPDANESHKSHVIEKVWSPQFTTAMESLVWKPMKFTPWSIYHVPMDFLEEF